MTEMCVVKLLLSLSLIAFLAQPSASFSVNLSGLKVQDVTNPVPAINLFGNRHFPTVCHRASRPASRYQMVSSMKMVSSVDEVSSAKSELLSIISGTNMGTSESAESAQRIDLLVDKLSSKPSEFSRAVVDGEWALVFTRNSKGSPVLQRATQSVERLGGSFANFDVSRGEFYNIAEVLGGAGTLSATVKFSESSENVSTPLLPTVR